MGSSTSLMCRLIPHNEMAIIKGFASNAHNFKKSYFFLRLDSASVVESCIPIFRRRWNQKVTNPLPQSTEYLLVVRNLLRGGPYFWEEELEPSMNDFFLMPRERDELFRNFLDSQGSGSHPDQVKLPGFDTLDPNMDDFFDFRLPLAAGKSTELS
ncbi:hypothetical protein F2Q69_00022148 [Brassica cretica]|uniref:Uncharacterized protein n=1 Tax=Brassica cretica TaxID=69181 RepID=A0A8S9Q5L6_BRACR|nr:hypothetical protein F2Q69_00022148 [Brassica cretica]